MTAITRLLQYGVSSELADRATRAGLSVTKVRTLAKADLVARFGMSDPEAAELKLCVVRKPIEDNVLEALLEASNHTCCVCKGAKGGAIIVHHIEAYEASQDNSYVNLAVLCPNDHDRAHRSGGLSLGLTADQIRTAKDKWEHQVEVTNAQAAAKTLTVDDDAIDYVNVMRIEEMCVRRFGKVPATTISPGLRRAGILGEGLRFDEKTVRAKHSNGRYLFDYVNHSESEHYRQLLAKLAAVTPFEDLSEASRRGLKALKALEGRYAYYVGGVHSRRPDLPITTSSPPIEMHHTHRKVRIVWDLDPNYFMSMSSISRQGRTNRYIIYSLVRTVEKDPADGVIHVTCGALLIAQPAKHVHRTPAIAYLRGNAGFWSAGWGDDEDEDDPDDLEL